ncbi:MAG: hypothetical protein KJ000_15320 [Pirellulaceae bacterium]|nr:hypothetical protein [Pirellulaceae bacterium]
MATNRASTASLLGVTIRIFYPEKVRSEYLRNRRFGFSLTKFPIFATARVADIGQLSLRSTGSGIPLSSKSEGNSHHWPSGFDGRNGLDTVVGIHGRSVRAVAFRTFVLNVFVVTSDKIKVFVLLQPTN